MGYKIDKNNFLHHKNPNGVYNQSNKREIFATKKYLMLLNVELTTHSRKNKQSNHNYNHHIIYKTHIYSSLGLWDEKQAL